MKDELKAMALRAIIDRLTFERGHIPGPSKREKAAIRDVSPCSEYTRYTMEGTLKDPFSDLAVLLDIPALGTLFINGPFLEPRWSPALGYGLAVIEDDTRIHLYRSGKFVIRRARDRDHVEACYRLVCDLVRPALVLPGPGLLFYEAAALQRHFSEAGSEDHLINAVLWPDTGHGTDGELRTFMEGPEGVRKSVRGLVLPFIRSLLSCSADGKGMGVLPIDAAKDEVISSMRASMKGLKDESKMMSSSAIIHLSALRSLDLIGEAHTYFLTDTDLQRSTLELLNSMDKGHDLGAVLTDHTIRSNPGANTQNVVMAALALIP
ncbi:MAG: hypothetical protein MUC62_00975 [Candidatus Thermoplasmatota archaeon]|jgi:hypothetical protein|nr:hypothetical protein [Candidatus Thermoplasmatota archaeon]